MHVLMVSKACLVGAYQTKLEAIARFQDIELTVIVPPSWRDPAGEVQLEKAHTDGYRLIVDPIRWNGHFHLHYYPRLGRRMDEIKPDILHMDEEPYNLATWLAMRQAERRRVQMLFFSWQNLCNRYPFPFNYFEKNVLARAQYALMGNQAAVSVWQAKGYTGPYQVIPQFGVSPDLFRPVDARDRGEKPGEELIVGVAGRRLVPEKGVDLVLTALAALPQPWQLRIAGEGPVTAALQQQAKALGIADRVNFVGVIGSTAMPEFLRGLDVLVLPSRSLPNWQEQFGRVLIEAMACEVAVVGSDSGEIPHVIGPAGLVFPEGDAAALRTQLTRFWHEPTLRAELGQRGRARVLAQYTQAQIAAQTVAVYRDIMLN